MKTTKKSINYIVAAIVVLATITSLCGILTNTGLGEYTYTSIRGEEVTIYGKGIYQHMSADVAVQGIGHDYVTFFIAIPLLIVSLLGYRRGSLRCKYLLTGTFGYCFVTFLFYTTMGMYNAMFLLYISLLALSFFGLVSMLLSFNPDAVVAKFSNRTPVGFTAGFLIFNAGTIAILWLGIVIPPLLDGSLYPTNLQHYTTLIVQGLDLGLLLPIAFVSAVLFLRKKPLGYLFTTVYFVFLSILMTALTGKIIAMAVSGVNVFPAVYIIPTFNLITILCTFLLLRNIVNK
jgi:hypothetical protein